MDPGVRVADRVKSPWDDEGLEPHHLDQCACRHSRDVHDEERCWACYVVSPQVLAPAYPYHAFHMAWPWITPVQTSPEVVNYKPPKGWDRPS